MPVARSVCVCAVLLGFVLFFSEASASILIFHALGTQTSALGTFIPGFPSVDWLVTCFADAAVLALGLAQGCSRNTGAFVIRGVPHTHHLQLEKKVSVFRLQDLFSFGSCQKKPFLEQSWILYRCLLDHSSLQAGASGREPEINSCCDFFQFFPVRVGSWSVAQRQWNSVEPGSLPFFVVGDNKPTKSGRYLGDGRRFQKNQKTQFTIAVTSGYSL